MAERELFLGATASEETRAFDLTPRQVEILSLIAQDGLSNKEIASELGISVKTVKSTLYQAFPKLGAKNRTHAVLLAIKKGLIQL